MFIMGPKATFTPLALCSRPMNSPRVRMSVRFHVAAALSPVGNAVTKSTSRTPSGESYAGT